MELESASLVSYRSVDRLGVIPLLPGKKEKDLLLLPLFSFLSQFCLCRNFGAPSNSKYVILTYCKKIKGFNKEILYIICLLYPS